MTREEIKPISEHDKVIQAWYLVDKFFKGDGRKTNLWFKTENPLLGGVSPYWMIQVGRMDKLLNFIKTQLAENCSM